MWFMSGGGMSDVGGDFRRQLPSMIGMAGMFVATIFLAMYIRPWYDKAGLQAFGEAGASQLRFIALELIMIFIFTAAILLLAKYKKEWVIKYGIVNYSCSSPCCMRTLLGAPDKLSMIPSHRSGNMNRRENEATYLAEIEWISIWTPSVRIRVADLSTPFD